MNCKYCPTNKDQEDCNAKSPILRKADTSYHCTRLLGHEGIHVACGNHKHNIVSWHSNYADALNETCDEEETPGTIAAHEAKRLMREEKL